MAKLTLKCGSAQNSRKKRRAKPVYVVPPRYRRVYVVPPGYLPVYVGVYQKVVYLIPVEVLSEILIKALLNQFKDENMSCADKPITLGCDPQFFEGILKFVNRAILLTQNCL